MQNKRSLTLYSFSVVMVLALLMLFSLLTFSSYSLFTTLAQDTPSVLSDDDERDDNESSEEGDDEEDSDEDEDEDENEIEDEDEFENEDESEDSDLEDEDEDEDGLEDEDSDDDDLSEDLEDSLEEYLESQKDLQEESIEQLEKLSERSGIVEFVIGPNIESIRELQSIIDANTRMLQQLQELKQKPLTEAEQQALDSLAGSIEDQNQIINGEINTQESNFSLFGWLLKLLSN